MSTHLEDDKAPKKIFSSLVGFSQRCYTLILLCLFSGTKCSFRHSFSLPLLKWAKSTSWPTFSQNITICHIFSFSFSKKAKKPRKRARLKKSCERKSYGMLSVRVLFFFSNSIVVAVVVVVVERSRKQEDGSRGSVSGV